MLRKLTLTLTAMATMTIGGALRAIEPEGHPLKDFYKQNGAPVVLPILKTDLAAKDLALTEDQKEKIAPLQKEMMESMMKAVKENINSQADRRKKMEEFSAEYTKKLETILQPAQLDRLLEIMTQMGGAAMLFQQSEVAKIFELTDEQKEKIKSINEDAQAKLGKAMSSITPPTPTVKPDDMQQMKEKMKEMRKEQMKKMQPLLKEANENIEKVLSSPQREKLAKMKGKEIDTAKLFEELADKAELPGM